MKKTILSLALATFAVSALANYSFYKTDATNIYVDGSLAADVDGSATTMNSKTDTSDLSSQFTLNLGTGASSTINGFEGGYYVKFSKTFLELEGKTRVPFEKLSKDDITKAYGYLSDNVLGKLSYGRMSPVSLIGSDLNTLGLADQTVLFTNSKLNSPITVAYSTPVSGGFQFNYSFSNSSKDSTYQRKNVWQFTYNYDSKDYGSFNASLGASYFKAYDKSSYAFKSLNLTNKANQFQLSVGSSDLVKNLNVTFVYSIGIQKFYSDNLGAANLTGTRSLSRSFLLKSDYTLNQYFKPYVGFGYTQTYAVTSGDKENATTQKIFQGYAGVNSTLYSLADVVSLDAYAEVADEFTKTYNPGKDVENKNVVSYAFGASIKF